MLTPAISICFGTMIAVLRCSGVETANATEGNHNSSMQDEQTDRVLREVSAQLATVNSVAELYNLMVRYNHKYCTFELLADLEKKSKSPTEKVALEQMKKFCEELENQHDIHNRALEMTKSSSNPKAVAKRHKQLQMILKRSNDQKTKCRLKKTVIELPNPPSGSIYYPRCTTVKRCSGCCKNPLQSCIPAPGKTKLVKRKVLMIQTQGSRQTDMFVKELTLEQHIGCECACPMMNTTVCGPLQEFNEHNCSCKCRNEESKQHCFHPRSWNPMECTCQCPPSLGCTSGRIFDEQTCTCIALSVLKPPDSREKEFNQVVE